MFHRTTNIAIRATIPAMTHVMGDARNAVLSPITAVFTIPIVFFIDKKSLPRLPTIPITLPATTRNTPSFNAMFMMVCTVCWLLLIHSPPRLIRPLTLSIVSLTAGSSPFPSSSALLCICCFSTWNFCSGVLLMASAISFVTDDPCFMDADKSSTPVVRESTLL